MNPQYKNAIKKKVDNYEIISIMEMYIFQIKKDGNVLVIKKGVRVKIRHSTSVRMMGLGLMLDVG